MKMGRQRWLERPSILGRSGTQYVAMVTKLLSSNCEAHLVESYCKESNNQSNLVECLTSSLGQFAYFKKLISLEQKEVFENSKQHFSFHAGYLFIL